jgi:hypothetical protein
LADFVIGGYANSSFLTVPGGRHSKTACCANLRFLNRDKVSPMRLGAVDPEEVDLSEVVAHHHFWIRVMGV